MGMAAGLFLRCTMIGRRSSRSMWFVLRRSSAMSVGRALHVEFSSAPTRWQLSEDRQGVTAGAQRVAWLDSWLRCAPEPSPGPGRGLCIPA